MSDLVCKELPEWTIAGHPVRRFELSNEAGTIVTLLAWGATLHSVSVPDASGAPVTLTRHLQTSESYASNIAYMGSICGRYAGRIAGAEFKINGTAYRVTRNNGQHHLHGGHQGFNAKPWSAEAFSTSSEAGVHFYYQSPDGEEGYPGQLDCQVTYALDQQSRLRIDYHATARNKPTVVNLTNHSYWNMSAEEHIFGQRLQLPGVEVLEFDDALLPTGTRLPVADSALDFTHNPTIAENFGLLDGEGFDHCYLNRSNPPAAANLPLAALLSDPVSGRSLHVYTDQPALVLYTGNNLDGSEAVAGHSRHSALCLECQQLPDAPNQPDFPSTVVRPDETWRQTTIYQFSRGL